MPDIYVAKDKKKVAEKKPPRSKPALSESVADRLKSQGRANPLASLVIHPKKVTFETQESREKMILLTRRHMATNAKWILLVSVLLILPNLLFYTLPGFLLPYRFVLLVLWYLATFSLAFEQFLRWFFNVNIITDERVVDIDFPSILYRDISSAKIDAVQDISVKMGGFVRSLFNYGDVHIQTAAEQREFIFEAIPQPERVIGILNDLIEEEEKEKIEGRTR